MNPVGARRVRSAAELRAELTRPYRWEVASGSVLLALGEAGTREAALDGLRAAVRALKARGKLLTAQLQHVAGSRRTSWRIPIEELTPPA